jgi:membrane protein YqaA with SNARE-associated domain
MGLGIAIGAVWGFAEATLFFLVPDVALTFLAILGPREAWAACTAAVAGAVVGGWLIYLWGRHDDSGLRRVLVRIPAIDRREIAAVRRRVERSGMIAVFLGPLLGTPYKLYAADAGRRGMSLPVFLMLTVPARSVRFVLATGTWLWLKAVPLAGWSSSAIALFTACFWIAFYFWYFRTKARRATRGPTASEPGATPRRRAADAPAATPS